MSQGNIADHVVLLDDQGSISKQGAPDGLSVLDDFITSAPEQDASASASPGAVSDPAPVQQADDELGQQRQVGDMSIYKYYFSSLGWTGLSIFLGSVSLNAAFASLKCKTPGLVPPISMLTNADAWLTLWSHNNGKAGEANLGYWLGLYGLFGILESIFLIFAV